MAVAAPVRLKVSALHQSPCPECGKSLTIGGGPEVRGYRYPAHYKATLDRVNPAGNCDGSGREVSEDELARLAAA
jgi:hypothetical protein